MEGILFDLDGTLLDTLEDLTVSVNYTLRHFGLPLRSAREVRSFVGNGIYRLIELSLPGTAADPTVEEALDIYRPHYAMQCAAKPYDGISEVLRALRLPTGIVSNKHHSAAVQLCGEYFPGIYTLGQQPQIPRKPSPDMLHKAMADLGLSSCVYVGDSEVDILTARRAGIPCLSVTWGFRTEEELRLAGASHFCHSPRDLPRAIGEILRGEPL